MKANNKNATPSFEQAMAELEDILETIASKDTPLQQSIDLYARAAALISTCNQTLGEAQVQIEEISKKIVMPEESNDL